MTSMKGNRFYAAKDVVMTQSEARDVGQSLSRIAQAPFRIFGKRKK